MALLRTIDRADSNSARLVAKTLFPDPKIRRHAAQILKFAVEIAAQMDGASWGVSLKRDAISLNVGRGEALILRPNRVEFLSLKVAPDSKISTEAAQRKSLPGAVRVSIAGEDLEREWPLWRAFLQATIERAASEFGAQNFQNPLWRGAHSPGVIGFLNEEFGGEIPVPSYFQAPGIAIAAKAQIAPRAGKFDLKTQLQSGLRGAGLELPDLHLAAFFTALQCKGFVVLSGRSGTGKTLLASEFAALFPRNCDSSRAISRREIQGATGRFPLPPSVAREIETLTSAPRAGEKRAIGVECDGAAFHAILAREGDLVVRARGAARKALENEFERHGALEIEIEIEEGRLLLRFLPLAARDSSDSNCLVLPVRADWRDSGALLGFWNPLANRYNWTPFLKFLLRARDNFQSESPGAFFVVLDEMNLARIEHYGADLLSVLESGRDERGFSRQPLRLNFDARAGGELPPEEIFWPPNLYIVGTLNEDETTFALSPKVLDRVWTIESPPVDFSAFLTSKSEKKAVDGAQIAQIFTRDGQFCGFSRELVRCELEEVRWRQDLSDLNAILENFERGFGFRAFEEIVAFVALARANRLFASPLQSFDCALSCKIAPRLRGLGGALESLLDELEKWAKARELPIFADSVARRRQRLEHEGFL